MTDAEATDGVRWAKPKLGLIEANGAKDNNWVMSGVSLADVLIDERDPDPAGHDLLIRQRLHVRTGEKLCRSGRQSCGQGGLSVVHMTDGPDIDVHVLPVERGLGHDTYLRVL